MAARQKETRHELGDGFVVVWDSSEPDENLREKLIEVADRQIGDIVVDLGHVPAPIVEPVSKPRVKPARRRRPRRTAA